jgi:hypothetical protein
MNMTLSDMGTAILFVVIAAALIVWFRAKLVSGSLSRMRRMMTSVGLDPDKLASPDAGAGLDMQAVRTRCRMCPAEDLCERWLAGEVAGDNGFCPNAKIFGGVVRAG